MKKYNLQINPQAFDDVQKGIDYYNQQQKGLGIKFHISAKSTFSIIRKSPGFQIRYDNIRCYKVKRFPYMIHFSVNDNTINIHAVVHTALNPDENWGK